MTKHFVRILMLAALIIATVQSSTFAEETEHVEIINGSDMSIAFLYVAPMNSDDWGWDRVGDEIMNLNDSRTVNFDPQFRYKIKIQLAGEGGAIYTWYDVDLSDTWQLAIWYNGTDFELSKNARG